MSNVSQFLRQHKLDASELDADAMLSSFLSEMEKGLAGEKSSLVMLPAYINADTSARPGESVIVMDAGGTNFRTCLVTFDDELKPVISDFRKVGMPGIKAEVSKDEFYSIFADNVERLIDKSDRIGFCFSYSAEITEDHDGIPLNFAKEVKAPEVLGTRLGANLLSELGRRGYDVSKKKVSVINDTVATLLAAKAGYPENASSYIGFILGTGTNCAYIEKNANIKKLPGLAEGSQCINIESGDYTVELGDLDKSFVASTKRPDIHWLEKAISGAYLGPFAAFVIEQAVREGVLSGGFYERYKNIEPLNTTRMSNYLEDCHNQGYDLVRCVEGNEDDASSLYAILKAVIERAGKLTAVNLTAAMLATGEGKEPRRPIVVNADGTTFYKTAFLEFYTRLYLDKIAEKGHGLCFRIINMDNSPAIGAAIGGLSI